MATHEGTEYSLDEGNLTVADVGKADVVKSIFFLRDKVKEIYEEIDRKCASLPQGKAMIVKIDDTFHTIICGRPKWIHVPVKDFDFVYKNATTKKDLKDFNL